MERVFLTGASMQRLGALWRGELPLGEAFWTWVVQLGIAVNVTTSILFYALVSADMAFLAFVAGYALSLPTTFSPPSARGDRRAATRARPSWLTRQGSRRWR
jgi:hypothetical protein